MVKTGVLLLFIILYLFSALDLSAESWQSYCYLLKDYYSILYGKYSPSTLPFVPSSSFITTLKPDGFAEGSEVKEVSSFNNFTRNSMVDVSLEGELSLNLRYGGDFSLKRGGVTGAGSAGIASGLEYDLIERILLEGRVGDRLFVEFNYDSERSEEGVGEEKNIYSVVYKGKEGEFLREVSAGNKLLSIDGSRYIPIDEGNPRSFALRATGGFRNLTVEGLLRYNEAFIGRKEFRGVKQSITMEVLDVDYVKGMFFLLPDKKIDEPSLRVYRSSAIVKDVVVDGKYFVLLERGKDYDFDNTLGRIYLKTALKLSEELIVYYTKNSVPVGDPSLGVNAIIDQDGKRDNFNSTDYSDYFGSDSEGTEYLYLKKLLFNSYWEMKNAYFLEEFQGNTITDVKIEILSTINKGINTNYDDLLSLYAFDLNRGVIFFNFVDEVDFYPRPFPGEYPYPATNPFDPQNPIYGGVGIPQSAGSINTLRLTYSYSTTSFFLDFNVVPGSVEVTLNGVLLDSQYYTVDYDFGILTFSEGVINPSTDIVVTYRYTGFGGGERSIFTALGVGYENGFLRARNLTSFQTALMGREAPEVGGEGSRVLVNSTEVSMTFGSRDDEETGVYAKIDGGFALSLSNRNAYGSAVVADMEKEDVLYKLDLDDEEWMIATKSSILTSLGTRGNVLYKNYWKKGLITGDTLQTLDWSIPSDQVFSYDEKAGPYNTADKPSGGDDTSIVIDYEFSKGSTDPYVTIVTPLGGANLKGYERFNIVLRGRDITGDAIRIYAELLGSYDEDINANGILDGERTINDSGFSIKPEDGTITRIGTDRYGESNGRIDSEDLNDNGRLDTGSENGLIIKPLTEYLTSIATGDNEWYYLSFDLLSYIKSNPDVFENAGALRITVKTSTSPLVSDVSGKLIINKIWFSGSLIVNNSPEFLNLSEVSTDEDPEVRVNAFSKSFPDLYEELHGSPQYRFREELVEKVLKVFFTASSEVPLKDDDEATLSRKFGSAMDISFYEAFKLYLFLPGNQSIPAHMGFTLRIMTSSSEYLESEFPGTAFVSGWNSLSITLKAPYPIEVNGRKLGNMSRVGDLNILRRVAEIMFGLKASGGDVTQSVEFWLDEWHVSGSKSYVDKAYFSEGVIGYRGTLLGLGGFSFIQNPSISGGYERREGWFLDELNEGSDLYFTEMRSQLFNYLGARVYISREKLNPVRGKEELPGGLTTGGYIDRQSHSLSIDLQNNYIPILEHSFDRTVTNKEEVELTKTDYRHVNETEYDESMIFSERVNFPFGLSQTYSYTRNWVYANRIEIEPSVSMDAFQKQKAVLTQRHELNISHKWKSNKIDTYLQRDEQFTGLCVPSSSEWSDSYAHKLSTILKGPEESLSNALLFSRTDTGRLQVTMPLEEKAGFFFSFDNAFTQLNFQFNNAFRDILYKHAFSFDIPFYFFGNEMIELTPSMERSIVGDFKRVDTSFREDEIIGSIFPYLLKPPFYYISPFKGLGRIKDYEAVDVCKDSSYISGTTSSSLYNKYSLKTSLDYEPWYIPTFINFSVDGETKRDGEAYFQSRGGEVYIEDEIPFRNPEDYYRKGLFFSFDYRIKKDYSTKVLQNSFSFGVEFNTFQSEYEGFKLKHTVSYSRERQKLGDERYYLIPGVPDEGLIIAIKPRSDNISSEMLLQYLWELEPSRMLGIFFARKAFQLEGRVRNTESIKIENSYRFTERERAGTFTNLPVRVTLEHTSDYRVSEKLEFGLLLKAVAGVEERVFPESVEGNILPSMGFEIGTSVKIIF
ncbi:MAG: hypothetical protein ACUVWJ_06865 [Spirochaetota bacterium]